LLLVHGTYTRADENWGWNYARILPEQGWDVCTVDLPDRSMGDIQVQAEYVVHAVRRITALTGEQVDVMGHSQGGLQPRWAVKWWPDVRAAVDDLVMLGTPNHGTAPAQGVGLFGRCHPSCWQMAPGSAFLEALNRDDETPGDVSYTSVYSLNDELVQPAYPEATAALDGASNVLMQELCPGRPVEHVQLVGDAAVAAVVLDALTGAGPFNRSRFTISACAGTWFADGDADLFLRLAREFRLPPNQWNTTAEPELACYAQPTGCAGASGRAVGGRGLDHRPGRHP
ncbi:MAG TPA: lipase, partial [Acidimicrobiia bacterium]|nr:lipase [Acidimicrobiia bacterium]